MESTKTESTEKTLDERIAIRLAVDTYLRAKDRARLAYDLFADSTKALKDLIHRDDKFILQINGGYYLISDCTRVGFDIEEIESL